MTKEEKDQLIKEAEPFIGRILREIGSQNAILAENKFLGYNENQRGDEFFPLARMVSDKGIHKDEDLEQIVHLFKITSK